MCMTPSHTTLTHFPVPSNSVGLDNGLEALGKLVGLIVRGGLLRGGDGLDDGLELRIAVLCSFVEHILYAAKASIWEPDLGDQNLEEG